MFHPIRFLKPVCLQQFTVYAFLDENSGGFSFLGYSWPWASRLLILYHYIYVKVC